MPKTREQIIHAMCQTWDARYDVMDVERQNYLLGKMAQVFDHEIAPLLGMGPTKANTVRVRIAVAIDEDGEWSATGWYRYTDEEAKASAFKRLDGGVVESISWIVADVPIPTPQVIEGVVQS